MVLPTNMYHLWASRLALSVHAPPSEAAGNACAWAPPRGFVDDGRTDDGMMMVSRHDAPVTACCTRASPSGQPPASPASAVICAHGALAQPQRQPGRQPRLGGCIRRITPWLRGPRHCPAPRTCATARVGWPCRSSRHGARPAAWEGHCRQLHACAARRCFSGQGTRACTQHQCVLVAASQAAWAAAPAACSTTSAAGACAACTASKTWTCAS
jgi:hypothetical protein